METKFNFKSQVCTSREQSKKLLALGLKKETANCYYWQECDQYGDPNGKWHLDILNDDTREHFEYLLNLFGICLHLEDALFIPAWSLHRLLSMLPDNAPKIFWILDGASITIDVENDCNTFFPHKGDIYKSVVDCIEWLIEEGYFNKDYLENGNN